MDYLHQAIEKARQKREGQIGQTPPPGDASAPGGPGAPDTEVMTQPHIPETLAPRRQVPDIQPVPIRPQPHRDKPVVRLKTPALLQQRVLAGDAGDPRGDIYRRLCSQVQGAMSGNGATSLAITGAHGGEGKTVTAINMAIALSQQNAGAVLLVDLDLRKPNLHALLDIESGKGIVDHLRDGEPIEELLLATDYAQLELLPGLARGTSVSSSPSPGEMKYLLEEIGRLYPDRLVIVDLPPLSRGEDAMAFVPKVDAYLLVIEDGVNTPGDVRRCRQLLKHANLLGTILNKAL